MSIVKHKVSGMDIKPPKKGAFQIPVDENFPKMHCLCVFNGRRGSGKSVAVANLVKMGKERGYIDKCWLISPTYYSNKEIWDMADIKGEDEQHRGKGGTMEDRPSEVIEPTTKCLKEVVKRIDAERAEWEHHLTMQKRYKEFKKDVTKDRFAQDLYDIDPHKLIDYHEMGFLENDKPPKWKYDHDGPARCCIILDDVIGTDLMKPSAGLMNFCIKHRHLGKGTGCSVFLLSQSYCCIGGIPRPIRENCTHLFLFKMKDENQLEKIHQEIGCDANLEKFDEVFKYATDEQHCFLTIDFTVKNDEEDKRFRKCFNEYLM